MRTLEFIVPSEYDGRKVLHYLRGSAGLSSRLIRNLKMFENGMMLNGVHVRTVDIIHTGDRITVNLPEDEVAETAADIYEMPSLLSENSDVDASFTFTSLSDYGVEILYEDEDLIVVNKPATLAIHPSHNHQGDTLANLIAAYLKTKVPCCRTQEKTTSSWNPSGNTTLGVVLQPKMQLRLWHLKPIYQQQMIRVQRRRKKPRHPKFLMYRSASHRL